MELQKIIITGASSGLGRELSKKLANKSNHLVLLGRNRENLGDLKLEIRNQCGAITCLSFDFLDSMDMSALVDYSLLEGASILINSAAEFGPTENLLGTSQEEISRAFSVNVLAPIMFSQKVLPYMINNNYGRIINIGSTGGLGGYALRAPYSISKNALIAFSKTLNKEIVSGEYGPQLDVKCFCLCPGPIQGERLNKQVCARAKYKNIPESVMRKKFISILGKILEPEEVINKIIEVMQPECVQPEIINF